MKRISKRLLNQIIPRLEPRWDGPFIIDRAGPHDSYVPKKMNGDLEPHPVNANHLAPYKNALDLNVINEAPGGQIKESFTNQILVSMVWTFLCCTLGTQQYLFLAEARWSKMDVSKWHRHSS